MAITRRGLLIGGLATGGLGIGASAIGLRLGAPAAGARVLTSHELAIVDAVAEVFFPGAPFPIDGVTAGVASEVDRIVGEVLEEAAAAAFRYVLRTLEWGTLASRGRRFTRMSVEERREVLETWSDPHVVPRRVAMESFKAVLGMAYFAHPEVVAAIGWRVGCRGRES